MLPMKKPIVFNKIWTWCITDQDYFIWHSILVNEHNWLKGTQLMLFIRLIRQHNTLMYSFSLTLSTCLFDSSFLSFVLTFPKVTPGTFDLHMLCDAINKGEEQSAARILQKHKPTPKIRGEKHVLSQKMGNTLSKMHTIIKGLFWREGLFVESSLIKDIFCFKNELK